jgi:hypothetical protein
MSQTDTRKSRTKRVRKPKMNRERLINARLCYSTRIDAVIGSIALVEFNPNRIGATLKVLRQS